MPPGGSPERTQRSRALAEAALVRVAVGFGDVDVPIVVIGGLVPAVLCAASPIPHQGTLDVDLQINFEVQADATNAGLLEESLLAAGFAPDAEHCWRWVDAATRTMVKVEFLCDIDGAPASAEVRLKGAKELGAANLRGTRYAAQDAEMKELSAHVDSVPTTVHVRFAGLAGYLLAKGFAAAGRRLEKDLYDIAYVLIHNDLGGPLAAAERVQDAFGVPRGEVLSMLREVQASFSSPKDFGSLAYARIAQEISAEGAGAEYHAADAYAAVQAFVTALIER